MLCRCLKRRRDNKNKSKWSEQEEEWGAEKRRSFLRPVGNEILNRGCNKQDMVYGKEVQSNERITVVMLMKRTKLRRTNTERVRRSMMNETRQSYTYVEKKGLWEMEGRKRNGGGETESKVELKYTC